MTTPKKTKSIIFPIVLTEGSHTLSETIESIKSSLKIIVSWPIRTRQFNSEFGSRIMETLEEPSDDILVTLIRRFIIDSITRWEQRIELLSINIEKPASEKINVNLIYKVKELGIQDSLFYTYYIN